MENSNSRDYLDKIKSAVIDNLRQTGPAPSVQMQDVPRKPFGGMTDEEEAELDDLDEDENKDVRMSERQWDKHVEHGAEFEPSDDDDMARKNGATRPKDLKRPFTDFRKGEMEVDSGNGSPVPDTNGASAEDPTPEETHDINDDTIEDISVQEPIEKELPEDRPAEKTPEASKAAGKTGVDVDGDVGMTDSAPTEETTTIKKEEIEPEAPPEKSPTQTSAKDESAKGTTPDAADKGPSPKSNSPKEAQEKSIEASEVKSKETEPVDAMDIDTEKDKPEAESKKKSKSPEH